MKSEAKIDFLIQIWALCDTIREGLKYLCSHENNEQIRSDVQAGLTALKANMSDIQLPQTLWNELETVCSAKTLSTDRVLAAEKNLSDKVLKALTKAMQDILAHEGPYIECTTAEKVFCFYDQVPHTNSDIFQLLVDTCAKSSLSAPMEAFEYTLKMFSEQPGILSASNTPHPGYVYKPSRQRTFQCCPICGGVGKPYYRAFSYAMADFGYPHLPVKLWMKCDECSNFYTWKHPEEYFVPSKCEKFILPQKKHNLQALGPANGQVFSIWSNILNKLTGYSNGKSVLEVGIGQGALLAVALEMGYETDAVEIMPGTAQNIANILDIPIWNGDFLNYRTEKTYSIITMGDVIEHISNPGLALRCAYRLLKPDGVLWLSTPNFESAFSRMRKFSDPMWLEPGHVSYFSYRGLEVLASKCGFVVKEYTVSNRYNGSMELILTKKDQEEGVEF